MRTPPVWCELMTGRHPSAGHTAIIVLPISRKGGSGWRDFPPFLTTVSRRGRKQDGLARKRRSGRDSLVLPQDPPITRTTAAPGKEARLWTLLDRQRRYVTPVRDPLRPPLGRRERFGERVLYAVEHEEHVAARIRRDVGVRSVHHVALEEDHGTDGPHEGLDAALVHQRGQRSGIGHADELAAQRFAVVAGG